MENVVADTAIERKKEFKLNSAYEIVFFLVALLANLVFVVQVSTSSKRSDSLFELGSSSITLLNGAIAVGMLLISFYAVAIFFPVFYSQKDFSRLSKFVSVLIAIFQTWLILVANSNLVLAYLALSFVPLFLWYWMTNKELTSLLENRVFIFTVRRHLAIVPMFLAISVMTHLILNTMVNPVELALSRVRVNRDAVEDALLIRYGFRDPETGRDYSVWERYWHWLNGFIHGDLQISYQNNQPVASNIGNFLWETLKMQVTSLVISFVLSIILGMLAAYYHRTLIDSFVSSLALLGLSMPIFVSGILAILIFSGTGLDWFPFGKAHSADFVLESSCSACYLSPTDWLVQINILSGEWWIAFLSTFLVHSLDSLWHLVLPTLTLTFATMATFARLTRGTMLEVMREDYILAARANGISEKKIVIKHAFPNVMLPLTTFLGLSIGGLLAGAPITETVFSWPGLGNLYVVSTFAFDAPMIMALTMIITLMILFANMLTDIAYTKLDPRISI